MATIMWWAKRVAKLEAGSWLSAGPPVGDGDAGPVMSGASAGSKERGTFGNGRGSGSLFSALRSQPQGVRAAAQRPATLRGKRIGLWWNEKAKGDLALRTVERELAKRYPGDRSSYGLQYMRTPTPAHAYEEVRVPLKLDLVIGATAD